MLDEGIDETLFGVGLRVVFGVGAFEESLVIGGVFPGENSEAAGEAVGAAVLGDDGLTFGTDRAG